MKKKLSPRFKETLMFALGSTLSAISLFLSLTGLSYAIVDIARAPYFLMGSLLALAVTHMISLFKNKESKLLFWSYFGLAGLCLILGILSCFITLSPVIVKIVAVLFLGSVIANRAVLLIENHKLHRILLNVLIVIAAVLLVILFFVDLTDPELAEMLNFILIFGILAVSSLKNVISYVFFKVKTPVLKEILRKTYAGEILLGLVILILSFSLVFNMVEEQMPRYTDALWYCFCIVTTIGLGDITSTTVIGRVLSVILGMYGIVVVALITSIIVNFYTEASKKHPKGDIAKNFDDVDEEQIEEKKDETVGK